MWGKRRGKGRGLGRSKEERGGEGRRGGRIQKRAEDRVWQDWILPQCPVLRGQERERLPRSSDGKFSGQGHVQGWAAWVGSSPDL